MPSIDFYNGHGQRTRSTETDRNLYAYVQNNSMMFTDPWGLMQAWSAIPKGYGNDTPELNIGDNCPKDCPFDGKKCDCPAGFCDIDPKTGANLCGGETVTVIAKDPADIGFIAEWIDFLTFASMPTAHEVKNALPYLKTDKQYQECQIQYLECVVGGILPFNPFSASTYVSQALQEISESYEEKAFDYAFKQKKLRYPNKSSVYRRFVSKAKFFGKLSLLSTIGIPAYNCIKNEIGCLSK